MDAPISTYLVVFGLAVFVPALLMVAGHYFPWHGLSGKPLHELQARTIGVGTIALTFTVLVFWLPVLTPLWTVALLWACIVGAGGATLAVWALDWIVEQRAKVAGKQTQVEVYERQLQA